MCLSVFMDVSCGGGHHVVPSCSMGLAGLWLCLHVGLSARVPGTPCGGKELAQPDGAGFPVAPGTNAPVDQAGSMQDPALQSGTACHRADLPSSMLCCMGPSIAAGTTWCLEGMLLGTMWYREVPGQFCAMPCGSQLHCQDPHRAALTQPILA